MRPVFDASSGTKKRQDGSGGRCLNDLVCKGPIDTLDLLRVVLGFLIGPVAFAADLTKMYNQFKLVPEMWNLQRMLFKEDLNPAAPAEEAIVTTAIYGVKSSSGQSENALVDLGEHVKDEKPKASKTLKEKRYVDNLLDSLRNKKEAQETADETEEVLARVGISTKGVSYSGEDPQPKETTDGLDLIEPKVPQLHFGNSLRGRLVDVQFFEGKTLAEMNNFVPQSLTRRMIVSKRAALYDPLGKFEPIKAKLKIDERAAVQLTTDWDVAKHKGAQTCSRISLQHVHIDQGMSLFDEINEVCIRCKKKRGKFIQASLGPHSEKQFLVAPPFYACQIDLFGPIRSYVPGFERETRASKVKESKVWIFVAVCIATGNINLQVCEMKDTASMLEAVIRLACECGYSKYFAVDQESSILAALREIKVDLRDLAHQICSENGTILETCAVGGHDSHGKVERTIKSVQESLDDIGFFKMRLPAMGIQTLCKQVENSFNNLPDNTEVLTYEAWYKIWCDVYIPKLMVQKTGFKNSRDLQVDDLIYFQKRESALSSPWTMGKITQIIRGRDGVIRRAIVKYRNSNEDEDRTTDRSVRKLIKLYSADDPDLYNDLSGLQARIDELEGNSDLEGRPLGVLCIGDLIIVSEARYYSVELYHGEEREPLACGCCCQSHCSVSFHNLYGNKSVGTKLYEQRDIQLEARMDVPIKEIDEEDSDECQRSTSVYYPADTSNFTSVYPAPTRSSKPTKKSLNDLIFGIGISFE